MDEVLALKSEISCSGKCLIFCKVYQKEFDYLIDYSHKLTQISIHEKPSKNIGHVPSCCLVVLV